MLVGVCRGEVSSSNLYPSGEFIFCSTRTVNCIGCGKAENFEMCQEVQDMGLIYKRIVRDCPNGWTLNDFGYWHINCWNKFTVWLLNYYKEKKQ